jgi:hypothetical protein
VEAVGLNKEELTLVIKCFKTTLKGHKEYPNKNKSRGKHYCFKCGKSGHFIAQCPNMKMIRDKKREKRRRRKRTIERQRARLPTARSGTRTVLHPTPTMRDLLPPPLPSHPSSPTSDIPASWLRRRRYVHEILRSTLLLVMRILMMM